MVKYKIAHDKDLCIGCGACVSMCPDNWEIDDEGKAKIINDEVENIGCNKDAKDSCPVDCIKIKEIK
ncbi:MAG: ferredoxin [Candidatus Aenigmarchaeota archaeon ex4484_52]|nr:MAG: ferredoxin [Candidatus Aenigmarchaeota archaeon ex4484_52]